jgi:AraC-like DNA-binding protein
VALINPDDAPQSVVVLAEHYLPMDGPWHSHRRAQLIHASEGVLTVQSATGLWVVPPQRGVWIPSEMVHKVSAQRAFWLHTAYVDPAAMACPPDCRVVAVDRLTNELLIEVATFDTDRITPAQARVMQVLIDRLPSLPNMPFHLLRPTDARLLRITQALECDPANTRTLAQLASGLGLSDRTAARLFQSETGLTFGKWRLQLRLLAAVERLSLGHAVSRVALEVGYEDTSAFISVFKQAFGQTPAKWNLLRT